MGPALYRAMVIRLLDPENNEADEGELGSRWTRAGRTDARLSGDDGNLIPLRGPFYRTGDVVQRDAEGYLTFVGRADDVFKASDYRISPFEVESALIEHADVVECAVVPSPIRWPCPGQSFHQLACRLRALARTALSIFRHSRRVLAPYKRVRRLEFVDLPKTISGKIRRVQLRTAEAERSAAGAPAPLEFREEDFPEFEASSRG